MTAALTLILILDASGSMWAPVPIQDSSRFAAAQRVVGELLDKLPDGIDAGLIAYGHRSRGSCDDIETLVPLGRLDREAINRSVGALVPKGKTPLAGAAEQAFDILEGRGGAAIVVLLTDGLGTCGGDLAATVQAARERGLDFALEVVGFYVAEEDSPQLVEAATAGCGRYFSAASADQLAFALDQIAVARLGAVSTVRDEFEYSLFFGDNGSAVWRFPWVEIGEQDGPGDGGEIEVEVDRTCFDGPCLNVEADAGSEGVAAVREVDLSGVDSAILSFIYGYDGDAGSQIVFEVSSDGGISWTTLETYTLDRVLLGQRASYDLTPWATLRTQIRFRVTVAEWGDLGIDEMELEYLWRGETGSVGDEFNAYSGNDGTRVWSGPWLENDDGDPESGAVRLTASPRCFAGYCLKLKPGLAGAGIYRQADLTGAVAATLTYHVDHVLVGDDVVAVEVSADGGRSYTLLKTYGENTAHAAAESFDLSDFISSEMRVRFRTAGSGRSQGLWVDDLQVEFTDPGTCSGKALARTGI